MSPLVQAALIAFALFASALSLSAKEALYETRFWTVNGPGGSFGLIEYVCAPDGKGRHPRSCELWRETAICIGTHHFSVPLSAPLTASLLIGSILVATAVPLIFVGRRGSALGK